MKNRIVILSTLLFAFIFSTGKGFAQSGGYDEVFDEEGKTRPHYSKIIPLLEKKTVGEMEIIKKLLTKDLLGDNALLPIPRILSAEENNLLREGVDQRARALRAFLQDHYSGKKEYLSAGVIPKDVLNSILQRNFEKLPSGAVNPKTISFLYGPDLIRGPSGQFFVIEDNPGFVGGFGDLIKAKESLFKRVPELGKVINSPVPGNFYKEIVEDYKKRLKGGEKIVFLRYSNPVSADNEDKRVAQIFADLGIDIVYLRDHMEDKRFKNSLVVNPQGEVKFSSPDGSDEKVGMVISFVESNDIEPLHPSVRQRNLINYAKNSLEEVEDEIQYAKKKGKVDSIKYWTRVKAKLELKIARFQELGKKAEKNENILIKLLKSIGDDFEKDHAGVGIPGLLDSFAQGKVNMTNGPGMEFIGDKQFYLYVENMITHYLGEEPIIKNLPTDSFGLMSSSAFKGPVLNEALMERVFTDPNGQAQYVVKRVDGRGGNAVWVGPKIPREEFLSIVEQIKAEPGAYIAQAYTSLSQVDGHIVDLRYHSDVGPKKVVVAPVPWGRGVKFKGGNGKVNLSDLGAEFAVLVDEKGPCLGGEDEVSSSERLQEMLVEEGEINTNSKKTSKFIHIPMTRSKKRNFSEMSQKDDDNEDWEQLYRTKRVKR